MGNKVRGNDILAHFGGQWGNDPQAAEKAACAYFGAKYLRYGGDECLAQALADAVAIVAGKPTRPSWAASEAGLDCLTHTEGR